MESIYKIIDVVGTSKNSWEEAAKNAVETAGKSLEDLRIAEIVKLDMAIDKNKVVAYRARVNIVITSYSIHYTKLYEKSVSNMLPKNNPYWSN